MAWAPSASPPCFNLRAHSDGEAGKGGKIKENVFCEGINGLPNLGEEPNWPSEGGFMPSAFRGLCALSAHHARLNVCIQSILSLFCVVWQLSIQLSKDEVVKSRTRHGCQKVFLNSFPHQLNTFYRHWQGSGFFQVEIKS